MLPLAKAYRTAFRLRRKPPVVAVELTNRCNAHCTMCWRDEVKRKHTDIPLDDFKNIVLKAGKAGTRVFQLSFFGESTLYHELVEAIEFIKYLYSDSFVTLNTNAAYLTEELTRQMLKAGIDQIRISIDGNNAEEYEKIRVGLKYDKVKENVQRLWKIIQDESFKTDVLIQGLHLIDYPIDEEKYQRDWGPFAHHVAVREEHDLIAKREEPFMHKLAPCPKVFSQSIVMVDGESCICAYDWHGNVKTGNVLEKPIKAIWNSSVRKRYQLMHLLGLKRTLPLCKDCTYQVYPY